MQVGDDQQALLGPVERAGAVGDQRDAGNADVAPDPLPAAVARLTRSHCIASFTSSASASRQKLVRRLAVDRLAADLQHHRHRERRDVVERLMDDSAPDAREHVAEPADVEQAGGRIGARRAQQDVVGLVLAQHVVDQVGRDRHLPARSSPCPGSGARSARR